MMKILLYGNFYEGNVADEFSVFLKQKKNKIYKFNRNKFFNIFKNKYLNKIFNLLFQKAAEFALNLLFLIKFLKFKPDIVFVVKGLNIYPKLLKYINKTARTVNWNLDDFLNPKNSSLDLINSIKLYDLIISPKIELFDNYRNKGAKRLFFLENFYFEKYFYPSNSNKIYNISFIGSWSKKRDIFINKIAKKHTVFVFGNSWRRKNMNNNIIKNDPVSPDDYRRIVWSSIINLNFLTDENNDTSNLRFFEISACNGLLLNEYSNRFENILIPNEETFYFKDANQILDKIDRILNTDKAKLNDMTKKALGKIKSHSFENRCHIIYKELQNMIK